MNTARTEICRAPSVQFLLFVCWESWKLPFYKEPPCCLNYQCRKKKVKEIFWQHPHWQEIQTFSSTWATGDAETELIGCRTLFWCVWDEPEAGGDCVRQTEREGAGGGGRGWIEHQNTLFLWVSGGYFHAQLAAFEPAASLHKLLVLGHDARPRQSSWDLPSRKSAFPGALWADHAHRAGINFPPSQYLPAPYRDRCCNFTPFPHFLCLTHGAQSPQTVNHHYKLPLASSEMFSKSTFIFLI